MVQKLAQITEPTLHILSYRGDHRDSGVGLDAWLPSGWRMCRCSLNAMSGMLHSRQVPKKRGYVFCTSRTQDGTSLGSALTPSGGLVTVASGEAATIASEEEVMGKW